MAAMLTPASNMATSSIQTPIQFCYTFQEKYLQVDMILGSLFEQEVIDLHLMMQIIDEPVQLKKRRLLLNHLCKQDHAVILTYCDILEMSADSHECIAPAHARIASMVRRLLSCDVREDSYVQLEEWEKEIVQFLQFINSTASAQSIGPNPFSTSWQPPQIHAAGILTSKIHQIITNVVLNLNRRRADIVVDLLMDKNYPQDLKVAILQVGCNDSARYIPKLESKGLALCQQGECQHPLILEFRLHTHLAWCYFTTDSVKCREHVEVALCLQGQVHHDVMSACLMLIHAASLAYDALQYGNLTPEVEQSILETAVPAALHHASITAASFDCNIFFELAKSYILCIYVILAECHRRKGNRSNMTSRMMSMKKLAEKCHYSLILSLLGNTETSWFCKIEQLWNMPATIEELLECNDPSKLLRCLPAEDSGKVKLAQSVSDADCANLTFSYHWVAKGVLYSRNAIGVIFKLFRMLIIYFIALLIHIS